MKQMIEDGVQVDSIVTDPPYELGFMGRQWDSTGIAFSKETWELALKLLKPGGHLLAFSGSRTYHRMAVAIEDAGFEIRDQIMWLYGSGFPKSLNIGKAIDKKLGNSEWEGWGTALKPAHEPLVMARKPLSEKTVTSNVLKHGTGGINIDGCRIEGNDAKYPDTMQDFKDQGKKSKEAIGINKLGFGQTENVARKKAVRKSRSVGGVWTNENSGMKQEANHYADADPRGRFPANVMHDGSDAVKDVFPTSKSRYFYSAKVSKKERNQGCDGFTTKTTSSMSGRRDPHEMDKSKIDNDVTGRFVTKRKNIHPTVKPVELMKYLCRLVTPKGGTVLDPFMGSGSTGMAAKYEEFDFIGIEREKEYFEIATSRIDSVEVSSTLESFFN
jgi:site-specific DNA-methyltransferase (adenine-specific)